MNNCQESSVDVESPGPSSSKLSQTSLNAKGDMSSLEESDGKCKATPRFVELYHVVKNVMEYLPLKDVLSSAQVCQQWSDIGRIVRKQRKNLPSALLFHPYQPHHKEAFEYFNGYEVSDEAKELVESGKFWYCGKSSSSRNKRRKNFSDSDLVKAAQSSFQKDFFKLYDEPQMLISFGTTTFGAHLVKEHEDKEYYKTHTQEKMKLVYGGIQDTIPCLTGLSCGLIAAIPESKCAKSLEMEGPGLPGLSCIGIPKTSSFTLKKFCISKQKSRNLRGLKGDAAVEKCQEILGITPEEAGNLKGIVLLHKTFHERSSPVVLLMREYLKYNPKVALAGGLHEGVLISGHEDSSVLAAGMLIFGEDDELVRVSSVALEDPQMTEINLGKVKMLNESLIPDGKSFAFMFACNGRGREMHGSSNVESDLFNSLFPSTPLIGAFTWGEFCHEVISNQKKGEEAPRKIDFAYTTVFMVVSYKQLSDGPDAN